MMSIEEYKRQGSFVLIIMSLVYIVFSGIFFGILHFTLETVETSLQAVDCQINDNVLVDSCQSLWSLSIYPLLQMRSVFVWFSFFFIFANILGMLFLAYQSGKSPALMGIMLIFVILMSYISLEVSNLYRTLIENDIFRAMMADFTVYNNFMLNMPWFVFIITLLSVMLSIIGWQKTKVANTRGDLDY